MTDKTDPLPVFAPPRRDRTGRYLASNPLLVTALSATDALLRMIGKNHTPLLATPHRILVANWAHRGDLICTFPAIAVLHKEWPTVRIGLLCGSWNRAVADATGLFDQIHTVNHPRMNRAPLGRLQKWKTYMVTRRIAVSELKEAAYDAAIDFYPYFPPASPLFAAARIPVRIGFDSGGFGPLLTHPVPFPETTRHITDTLRDVLQPLLGDSAVPPTLAATYPGQPRVALPDQFLARSYVLLHIGTGSPIRQWPEDHWAVVVDGLVARGIFCVLAGSGTQEAERVQRLHQRHPRDSLAFADQPWDRFVAAVARAAIVLCGETVTGHIAACFARPTIAIYSGITPLARWRPNNPLARVLVHPVGCAPCYRSQGCTAMRCVRGVGAADVLAAFDAMQKA